MQVIKMIKNLCSRLGLRSSFTPETHDEEQDAISNVTMIYNQCGFLSDVSDLNKMQRQLKLPKQPLIKLNEAKYVGDYIKIDCHCSKLPPIDLEKNMMKLGQCIAITDYLEDNAINEYLEKALTLSGFLGVDWVWFAVDSVGHIGFFEVGGGELRIPRTLMNNEREYENYKSLIFEYFNISEGDKYPQDVERLDSLGVYMFIAIPFLYGWTKEVKGKSLYYPYEIRKKPSAPLHVDQLPENIRAYLESYRLNNVNFETDKIIDEAMFW